MQGAKVELLVAGYLLLVTFCWLLVAGCLLLVTCCWLLASGWFCLLHPNPAPEERNLYRKQLVETIPVRDRQPFETPARLRTEWSIKKFRVQSLQLIVNKFISL